MNSEPHAGSLSTLDAIVHEITACAGVSPGSLMLVGAFCRDFLHHQYGAPFPVRTTSDADIGMAIDHWGAQRKIDSSFPRAGTSGIRYTIAGFPVDVMPFGDVEDPEGTSTPPRRGEGVSVFGFQDVHARATDLELPTAGVIKVPTAPGYGALKLAAWLDRSPQHITKDASDLAIVAQWYEGRDDLVGDLYESEDGVARLARFGYDPVHAAIGILARDIGDTLAPSRRSELRDRLKAANLDAMASYFSTDNTRVPEAQFVECRRRVDILVDI